jgi:hypothetical protein
MVPTDVSLNPDPNIACLGKESPFRDSFERYYQRQL